MSYWSLAAILVSLLYLVYRNPHAMWTYLSQWIPSGEPAKSVDVASIEDKDVVSSETASAAEINEREKSDLDQGAISKASKEDVPQFSLTTPDDANNVGKDSQSSKKQTLLAPGTNESPAIASPSIMAPPPRPTKTSNSSFPAPNSAQRVGAGGRSTASSGLMAPPGGKPTSSLRIPSTGPIPNRGPPVNSQQRADSRGLGPPGTVSTLNTRGKVILSPGHSPMDWAALTKSGNVSGVSTFQRVTPSQLRTMTGRKGKPAWSSWQGKVYNITPYLPFHPGGEPELMKAAGRDGTKLFMEVHPWVNWENMLGNCLVGVMVPEDYGRSDLEDMD
nr:cytochrome b5 reductase 4 [Quercus suber]